MVWCVERLTDPDHADLINLTKILYLKDKNSYLITQKNHPNIQTTVVFTITIDDLLPRPEVLAPEALGQVFGGCRSNGQRCDHSDACCPGLSCGVLTGYPPPPKAPDV
jgi:hypothetical protein